MKRTRQRDDVGQVLIPASELELTSVAAHYIDYHQKLSTKSRNGVNAPPTSFWRSLILGRIFSSDLPGEVIS